MSYQKYDFGDEAQEILDEVLDTLGLSSMPIGLETREKLIREVDKILNGLVERQVENAIENRADTSGF